MKSKKFNKVLTLNKSTISNLDSDQMDAAKGGYWYTRFDYTCYTWCGCQTNYFHCPSDKTYICP
ncbi:MAG TPA: class I lanthipeptide [Candidatus Deferrimicrobium sp.]|nr:class I lanthipeptide [Candidatus Kapabacteria bacterium]HLP57387.1 class I lanthipeptide [Candidatus Deferrimicrobium sp.]